MLAPPHSLFDLLIIDCLLLPSLLNTLLNFRYPMLVDFDLFPSMLHLFRKSAQLCLMYLSLIILLLFLTQNLIVESDNLRLSLGGLLQE